MLAQHHALMVSRETLRKWMIESGFWLSRKERRSFHQPRLRRQAFGELIQIDGSEHRWFEGRGDACTLLVFIDDATGPTGSQLRTPLSAISEADPFIAGIIEIAIDPLAVPAIFQVALLVRDADGARAGRRRCTVPPACRTLG